MEQGESFFYTLLIFIIVIGIITWTLNLIGFDFDNFDKKHNNHDEWDM